MLQARLDSLQFWIESKINTNSVGYQQYRNLYLKGKISLTQLKLEVENLSQGVITLKGNGSKTRIKREDDLSAFMVKR